MTYEYSSSPNSLQRVFLLVAKMKSVVIVFSAFLAVAYSKEVNSTLLNQLTGKAYRVRHPEDSPARHYQDAIVYFLGNDVIYGLGVCLRGGTIITHDAVITESEEPYQIYIPNKNRYATATLIEREDAIVLLKIEDNPNFYLSTVKYVSLCCDRRSGIKEVHALGVGDYPMHRDCIAPDIEDVKGIIAPFEDPYIYVIHSTPRLYEKEGDPIFSGNELVGLLSFPRNPEIEDCKSTYRDLFHLNIIKKVLEEREHPPIETNKDHQVNRS